MPWVDKDIRVIFHMKLQTDSDVGFIGQTYLRPQNGQPNEIVLLKDDVTNLIIKNEPDTTVRIVGHLNDILEKIPVSYELFNVQTSNQTLLNNFNFLTHKDWIDYITHYTHSDNDVITKVLQTEYFEALTESIEMMNVKMNLATNIQVDDIVKVSILGIGLKYANKV